MGNCASSGQVVPARAVCDATESSYIVKAVSKHVFLGGACDPTTWRKDFIPLLELRGLTYYNPQGDWHEGLMKIEMEQKETCQVLYFEIGPDTSAMASCVEAAYFIALGRVVVLSMRPYPETLATLATSRDINRMRKYLREVAEKHCVRIFDEPGKAVADHITSLIFF